MYYIYLLVLLYSSLIRRANSSDSAFTHGIAWW